MLADVTDEVDERVVLHPVVIVHEFGLVRRVGLEIQEAGQLGLEAGDVVGEGLLVQEVALRRFHRRVADHAGGSAHQGEGLVAAALEMLEDHHADEMSDMEGVGRGVDAYVGSLRAFHEFLFRSRHDVLDHASPSEFFYKVLHLYI